MREWKGGVYFDAELNVSTLEGSFISSDDKSPVSCFEYSRLESLVGSEHVRTDYLTNYEIIIELIKIT